MRGRPSVVNRLGPLGFGAATLGNLYEPMSDEQAAATVEAAWDTGVRYYDSAPHYGLGLSERRLGAGLGFRARDAVISTKVGRLLEDGHPPRSDLDALFDVTSSARRRWDFSATGVRRSLTGSLTRMGVDRIDIALVHDPDEYIAEAVGTAIPTLCRLRDDGVIGAVGAGVNDTELAIRLVADGDLDVVMIAGRYTLLDQRAGHRLLPLCTERGITVIAAAPFNSGLLASPHPEMGGRFDYATAPGDVVERATAIGAVCAVHGIDLPEAALRFPLQHPAVATVVASARSPTEVRENAARVATASERGEQAWDDLWADLRDRGLIETEAR